MDLVLLGLRLILVAVLLVSAIAKLLDPDGSRAAVRGFGVPGRFVHSSALALPVAELGVAGLLVFGTTALPGALAALGLFVVFTAAIANQLRQGNAPPCHCFGALSREPVSPRTLVRNGALILMAATVVWMGWAEPGPGLERLDASSSGAAWVLVLALGAVLSGATVVSLRRLVAVSTRVDERLDELTAALFDAAVPPSSPVAAGKRSVVVKSLPAGSPAPTFELTMLDGRSITESTAATTGRRVALLLSAESCTACHALLPEIGKWQAELSPNVDLVLVGLATGKAYRTGIERHGIRTAALPDATTYDQVMTGFGVAAVPSLVEIGPDGRLTRPIAGGVEEIREMVAGMIREVVSERTPQPGGTVAAARPPNAPSIMSSSIGTPIPALELTSADGHRMDLAALSTRSDLTLLLFWRPDCPHCQGLLPVVREWRDGLDRVRMQVVAITSGSAVEVAAQGVADLTLSDPMHTAHDAFGSMGSPSGILLDRNGRIASALVVGSNELGVALHAIRGPLLESRSEQRATAGIAGAAPVV